MRYLLEAGEEFARAHPGAGGNAQSRQSGRSRPFVEASV
ncbi:hypothetical protein LNP74_22350 [Klebsiella pneumoniae subsp. pneumoniae]|nr:hypothetical protein [Klebsiella pneumoniae subsp. pneumoniae]